jgi:hypothetical protein
MELWLETIPFASISKGANAWIMARGPQTLTSYSLFASAMLTSSSGLTNSIPRNGDVQLEYLHVA